MKMKDIPGLMISKIHRGMSESDFLNSVGYNQAIDAQGEVKIGLNREKLASILYLEKCDPHSLSLTDTDKIMIMEESYREAEALIQNQKDLLEVVK